MPTSAAVWVSPMSAYCSMGNDTGAVCQRRASAVRDTVAGLAPLRAGQEAPDQPRPPPVELLERGPMPLSKIPATRPRSDTLVMLGVTGDLAKKKLIPAVYRLHCRGLLGIPVVGLARPDWSQADLAAHVKASLEDTGEKFDQAQYDSLMATWTYVSGDYNDPDTFVRLKAVVGDVEHPIFHMAIPPSMFECVAGGLAAVGLDKGARLIVEKPFGRDLESARELNDTIQQHFPESAIFRIDHFLGKEAMRSLLITRFANAILEPLWRRTYVSSVKITMAEAFGVEDRGSFYDSVGALRDVMQNHLLQMVALFAMEQPVNEHSKALRDEKAKVLQAARAVDPKDFVRGQYRGYRSVPRRRPRQRHRDLRRLPARVRLAPLGWRALLPAGGQGAGRHGDRDDHRVRAAAPAAVDLRRPPPAAQPHPHRGQARQLHRADLAAQGPGRARWCPSPSPSSPTSPSAATAGPSPTSCCWRTP